MKYSHRGANFEALKADLRLVTLATKPKQSVEPSEVLAREFKSFEKALGELVNKLEK